MAAHDDKWQSTRDSVNDIAERLYLPPVFWEPPLDYRQNDDDAPYDIPPPTEDRPRKRYLYTLSIAFSLVLHGAVLGYAGTYIFLSQPQSNASVESTGSISVDLVDSDVLEAKRPDGAREVALAPAFAVRPEGGEQQNAQTPEKTAQREPDTPNTPDEPGAPEKPDEPNAPDEPSVPDTPDEPDAPNEPDTPDAPPEQVDTKAAPANGPDDAGKPDLQEKPASAQPTEEAATPQEVASINAEPPLPASNPRRDAPKSKTAEQTGQNKTASIRTTSRKRRRSWYRRRARASRREIIVYRKNVRAYLATYKPNGGRGKGTVRVTFRLSSTGRVVAARVTRSSGKRVLDQAALSAVYDASPFPHPPKGIRTSRLRFSIPFYFR
jgi:TonB family protein